MDTLGLAATVVSLVIFVVALHESLSITKIIGKIPRFWIFFLLAISFLIVHRLLELGAAVLALPLPSYWSALDTDGTPIIFSALLLLWVYDMKKSFEKAVPKPKKELLAPEQA